MHIKLLLFFHYRVGNFYQKIEIIYDKMVVKVFNVLCPFLGFAFKPFFKKKLITSSL